MLQARTSSLCNTIKELAAKHVPAHHWVFALLDAEEIVKEINSLEREERGYLPTPCLFFHINLSAKSGDYVGGGESLSTALELPIEHVLVLQL